MIKVLIFLLLFCTNAFAGVIQIGTYSSGGGACTQDAVSLIMDGVTDSDGTLSLTTDAYGQEISYASQWDIYSIEIGMSTSTNCVMSVRIGASADLDTYIEQWDSVAISDAAGDKEFLSVSNDTYSSSTTYYIGFIEESGSCAGPRYDSSTPPYAGGDVRAAGTVWEMGSGDSGRDYFIKVYQCE